MRKGKLLSKGRRSRTGIDRSRKQEKTVAEEVGGKTQPGSGSQWHSKGDVVQEEWMIECKSTTKGSFRITQKMWEQLEGQGFLVGKAPVICLEIGHVKLALVGWTEYVTLLEQNQKRLRLMEQGKKQTPWH